MAGIGGGGTGGGYYDYEANSKLDEIIRMLRDTKVVKTEGSKVAPNCTHGKSHASPQKMVLVWRCPLCGGREHAPYQDKNQPDPDSLDEKSGPS